MTLRRLRPQWAREEDEGWELQSVDRENIRYLEGDKAVDIPVEHGCRPDDRVTSHLYVDELAWRAPDGELRPLSVADAAVVVPRVVRAVEFLGTVPVVVGAPSASAGASR